VKHAERLVCIRVGPDDHAREPTRSAPSALREPAIAVDEKVVTWLAWRGTHVGPYGGVAATGKRVEVRDTAVWRFEDGKVVEIRTMQDQFAFLRQVGFLPPSIYAA
jgi:ketosteroid isomerase-like protein